MSEPALVDEHPHPGTVKVMMLMKLRVIVCCKSRRCVLFSSTTLSPAMGSWTSSGPGVKPCGLLITVWVGPSLPWIKRHQHVVRR